MELKKVLSSGTFYYSVDFDLTNRLQSRCDIPQQVGVASTKARTGHPKTQPLILTVSKMTSSGTRI